MNETTVQTPVATDRRRIFLVDDHPLVREWLGSLIERQSDLAVCGQAETAADALQAITQLKPDAVVVDLSLSQGSGLDLIKQLQALPEPPAVLVLSMHDEVFYAERSLRAGALGYVMKRSATGQVIEAIRHVLAGERYISPALAAQMAEKFVARRRDPGESPISRLSDREIEVFRMFGRGYETRKISEELNLSIKTVQVYCARIKDKLGLENATELIREAVRWAEHEHEQKSEGP